MSDLQQLSFGNSSITVRAVSESEDRGEKPAPAAMTDLLSALSLGPAWAKGAEINKSAAAKYQGREFEPREERSRGGQRDEGRGGQRGGGGRDFRGGGGGGGAPRRDGGGAPRRDGGGPPRRDDFQSGNQGAPRQGQPMRGGGRDFRDSRDEPQPPKGVRVEIRPAAAGMHAVAKEILHLARVYSLFEIAKVLLAARDRYQAHFSAKEPAGPMFACLKDGSLWLSREEAMAHLWNAEWLGEYYAEEQVEIDPPKGNFQGVARCGISGDYLGPPNYHGYQTAIRQLHRERFAHMSFEQYASKVRTERGEEAVNAWLATMSKTTRFRATGMADEPPLLTKADVERHFGQHYFSGIYAETREASVSGDIAARHLSPPLLTGLKWASAHARKHPATLIPELCRGLEKEHLPIFKRQGKLFTGPARPHPLDEQIVLADRPAAMCHWLGEHQEAKLAALWQAVLPEGQTEPTEEWLRDLFWLLTQGHVLLLQDDSLVLPVRRPRVEPAAGDGSATPAPKKKRKRNRKRRGRPLAGVKSKIAALRKAKPATSRKLKVVSRQPIVRPTPVQAAEPDQEVFQHGNASPDVRLEVILPPSAVAAVVPEVTAETPEPEAPVPQVDAPAAELEEDPTEVPAAAEDADLVAED